MKYIDIKKRADEIYNDKSLDNDKAFDPTGKTKIMQTSIFDQYEIDKSHDDNERHLRKEKLVGIKGLNSSSELRRWYWDYSVELYNRNKGAVREFNKMFEERLKELVKTYYFDTYYIISLYTKGKVAKKVYRMYPERFKIHVINLCNRNIFDYDMNLKNRDPAIINLLNQSMPRMGIGEDQMYIDRLCESAKTIAINITDLKRKIETSKFILNRYLFNPNRPYKANLKKWDELYENDKVEIKDGLKPKDQTGRPYDKETPQKEIEKIVHQLFNKFRNDEMISSKKNGQQRAYQIVHQTDRYGRKGKANINQICKYFRAAHPDLVNIENRWFKERIEKALPDEMM